MVWTDEQDTRPNGIGLMKTAPHPAAASTSIFDPGGDEAAAQAAVDALSELGVKHVDMMLRPEKLWRIIHGGQA